jgi:hypothetical protein
MINQQPKNQSSCLEDYKMPVHAVYTCTLTISCELVEVVPIRNESVTHFYSKV